MKKFLSIIALLTVCNVALISSLLAQITTENGIPTGMSIKNFPATTSNSYYQVNLNVAANGRASGGISFGLENSVHERYWINHLHTDNNLPVGKFFISYGAAKRLTIDIDGNVGIGTVTPSNKLEVNGTVRAKEVRIEAEPWPDYVFTRDYKLPSLLETEKFIDANGHLPEIPSADTVAEDGIALGEMNSLLLKKIEELTLYLIEKDKNEKMLVKQLEKMNERIEQLENDK